MARLIVNVDDLGLHPAVTRAVETLGKMGRVHRTSVMANMPYVEDGDKNSEIFLRKFFF